MAFWRPGTGDRYPVGEKTTGAPSSGRPTPSRRLYSSGVSKYPEPAPKYTAPIPELEDSAPGFEEQGPKYPGPASSYLPYEQPLHNCTVVVSQLMVCFYTDKKENIIFLIFKKIQKERLQSHIWLTAVLIYG